MCCPSCPPTPGELLAALWRGEEGAAGEALEQWLGGSPDPLASCPMRALELVVDLMREGCQAGADPSAVARVGREALHRLLERLPEEEGRGRKGREGEMREPLREAARQWTALVRDGARVSEGIRRAVAYLHTHYADPVLKQEEVARAARLSPSCFSQAFREEMGVTYASYLRDLRLEEARRLLRGTSYSLPEIAQEVGYQTPSALHRAFKKAVGMAPGQYRQQFARPGSP